MRNKHYDVIMAWANGEPIQIWSTVANKWDDWNKDYGPMFHPKTEYRVKPKIKTIKYRVFQSEESIIYCVIEGRSVETYFETRVQRGAGRWITDWLTVEYTE